MDSLVIPPSQIRAIGRRLKVVRESQGHNLSILAGQCNLSVVQLTGIERGDTLPFSRSQENLLEALQIYAKVLGVPLEIHEGLNKIEDDDIYIPEFLRKK